ncbi:MAG: hypothetical protein KDA61_10475 [Planctomycetales bacterium]|nr:hypothetical protein [Planctomycetales bacterium]
MQPIATLADAPYQETFWQCGKYLLPRSAFRWSGPAESAPRGFKSLGDIAAARPECLKLHSICEGEQRPAAQIPWYESGSRRVLELPPRDFAEEYVAEIPQGLFYGRHCTAIAPCGNVVRESGFFIDPADIDPRSFL